MTRGEMMAKILENARALVLLLEQAEHTGMGPEWERMVDDRLDALADLAPSYERVRGRASPLDSPDQPTPALGELRRHTERFADVLHASADATDRMREEIADQKEKREEQRWELLMTTMREMTLAFGEIKLSLRDKGIGG